MKHGLSDFGHTGTLAYAEFQVRVLGPMSTAAVATFPGRLADGR